METRTIRSIVYEKYLDTLERTSFERILDTGAKIGAGVIISATLVNADAIRDLLIANDYMAIKIIAGMGAGWYGKKIIELSRKIPGAIKKIFESEEGAEEDEILLEGVSVSKISSFILETKGWKRAEAEKIGLGRAGIERIGKGLERVGAFVRGEANARILRDGYDRESLEIILENAATIGEYTATPPADMEEEKELKTKWVRTAI